MSTTTWGTAREELSRELGFLSFGTTTDITTDNSIVSTNLADDYDQPDYFNSWFVLIRGTKNDEVPRRVTDYVATSGTLTVAGAVLAAESGSVTCELYKFRPKAIRDAFNRARQNVFPHVAVVRDHRTIVTGQRQRRYTLPTTLRGKPINVYLGNRVPAKSIAENLLTDPGFEDWSSATALANYTLTGTGASVNREQETTNPKNYGVLEGEYSARVEGPSSGTATLLQTVTPSVAMESIELNLSVWAYALNASLIAARLEGAGVNATTGSTHGGTGWEQLLVSAEMKFQGAAVDAGILIAAGTKYSYYVDEAVLVAGQSEALDFPWTPLNDWQWIPPIGGASDNGVLVFDDYLPEKKRLRIVGRDMVSSVSADSDAIEIDGEELEPLYDWTRLLLAREAQGGPTNERAYWAEKAREFQDRVDRAYNNGVYASLPNPRVLIPDKR